MTENNWDLNHVMDPETEDLVYGTDLREGMYVLVEDRFNFDKPVNLDGKENYPGEHDRLRSKLNERNRWCTVTRLRIDKRFKENDYGSVVGEMTPLVRFIGVYDDGTKRTRTYDGNSGWFVKLDSLSTPTSEQETYGQDSRGHALDENGFCADCDAADDRASNEALQELRNKLLGVPEGATQSDYVSENDI